MQYRTEKILSVRVAFCASVIVLFYCSVFGGAASSEDVSVGITGIVVYEDSSPAPGTVVYALDLRHRLDITNNTIMMAEHIPRAITDMEGRFTLKAAPNENTVLFARDLEDRCGFALGALDKIVIQEHAVVKGQLFRGAEPVKGQKVTGRVLAGKRVLRYLHSAVTDEKGNFEFEEVMPGEYAFEVIEEVPQVGCSFGSVVTKRVQTSLQPGEQKQVKLGGTDLPFLQGAITDSNGSGLHGVWVRLEEEKDDDLAGASEESEPAVVLSDVTERDGSYRIFDIPPGDYTLHCFRRLAANDSRRTLQAKEQVTIGEPNNATKDGSGGVENIRNVSVDVEAFMPLEYGSPAPLFSGTLLDGRLFHLSEQRDKIIVLHFYASWCKVCVSSVPGFERLADKFGRDRVMVIGVNLDNRVDDCMEFVSQRQIRHPQLFAGPWASSYLRKLYHVVDVPTTFVIDKQGRIAQIDLFEKVLDNFIQQLLRRQGILAKSDSW